MITPTAEVCKLLREDPPRGMEMLAASLGVSRLWLVRRVGRDADDVLHDVFLQAVAAAGRMADDSRFPAVVALITRRWAAKHARVAVRTADLCSSAHYRLNPEELAIAAERRRLARRLLASLRPLDRDVLSRVFLRGQSCAAVRGELGLSAGALKNRRYAALQRCRAALAS